MCAPILIRGLIILIAIGIAWLIRGQLIESSHRRFEEHQWVKLIDEPPPPPPPKAEPIPEPDPIPEPVANEIQEDTPQPDESSQSSDDVLGADEEGRAGSDSFGIRSKKGGKDLLQSSSSGKKGPMYLAYGGEVSDAVERMLSSDRKLKEKNYVAIIRIWINAGGKIERVEIDQTSGDRDIDHRLLHLLSAFSHRLPQPPVGIPQPIRIRLTSKVPIG